MEHYADFADNPVSVFYPEQMQEMRQLAEMNQRPRYRVCAHSSPDDELQEMYICAKDEGYIPPEMHPDTAETHYILKGTLATVLFDDVGNIKKVVVLDGEVGALSCRVGKGIYHMDFFISEWVTFLEFKKGPFTQYSNVVAPWAPKKNDKKHSRELMRRIYDMVVSECDFLGIRME